MDIDSLKKRREKLLKAIENVQNKKSEIFGIVNTLLKGFNSGRISKFEYERELSKALGGKSVEQWTKYYDDYLDYYENQLKLADNLIKKEKRKGSGSKRVFILKSLIGLVLIGIVISLIFSVGPVVIEKGLGVFERGLDLSFGREKIKEEVPTRPPLVEKEVPTRPPLTEEEIPIPPLPTELEVISKDGEELLSSTIQYPAVVGEKVKFKTKIKGDLDKIVLPEGSEVSKIYIIEDGVKKEISYIEKTKGFFEKKVEVSVTGKVIEDLTHPPSQKNVNNIKQDKESSSTKSSHSLSGLVVNNVNNEYEVIYEIPGPEIYEIEVSQKNIEKRVVVKGRDDLHFENILAFSDIDERLELGDESKIIVYRVFSDRRERVNFNAYDNDEDGLIDRLEWIVPYLSDAVYEIIIEISKAEHLDSGKNFISDVYEEVRKKDEVWSEKIYHNEYVRITFKQKLDSSKDITIYARSDGDSIIEVYNFYDGKKLGEFNINNEGKYRFLLTELAGESDVFDLRILNDAIEIDYIVDPTYYISDCQDLQNIENDLTGDYILMNDIDCSDSVNWDGGLGFNPIGDSTSAFTGTFDGQGHVITGLYINRDSQIGLFSGAADTAKIENVGLEDVNITGGYWVGGLVGYYYGTLINNSYVKGYVKGLQMVGGLTGYSRASISNSYANVNVSGNDFIGGLTGVNDLRGSVINSYSIGGVTGSSDVGGLVGSNYALIKNSFTIAGGGLCVNHGGTITNSYYDVESVFYGGSHAVYNGDPLWDFANIWRERINDLPIFQWQEEVCNPPTDNSAWEIDGLEICRNREIIVNNNVIIKNGGVLKLYNTTLYLDMASNNKYKIYVYNGGTLSASENSYFHEYGDNFYYYIRNYGDINFNNITTDDSRVRIYAYDGSVTRISNLSDIYYLLSSDKEPVIIASDSLIRILEVYVQEDSDVHIDNFNEDNNIDYNITSSTTNLQVNLTNIDLGDNGMRLYNHGGRLNITNSNIYWLTHRNYAEKNTYVSDTILDYFYYSNWDGTFVEINDVRPPYTKDSVNNFTKTITALNNNKLVFDNVGLTNSNSFYALYTRYAGSVSKSDNCSLYYVYTYNHANLTLTNSRVDKYLYAGQSNGIASYSTIENVSAYRLYSRGGGVNKFTNFSVSSRAFFYHNASNLLKNSDLKTGGYTRIYDSAVLNFTKPGSRIEDLDLLGSSETPTIHGFVEIVKPIDKWDSGNTLNRFFPFKVVSWGMPVSDANVSIWDGSQLLNSGLTDFKGEVVLNISADNSGNPYYNYSVYLDSVFKRNITMLENTSLGVILKSVPDPPEIVFISDIEGYLDSTDVPSGDRDLVVDDSVAKRFEFYVWSEDLSVLPVSEISDNDAKIILMKDVIVRASSDGGKAETCVFLRDDVAPVGSVGHEGEQVRVYSCKVEMWYSDDYGSESNKNWKVDAVIRDSFSQEDSENLVNNLAQPNRNTYFNRLEGFKVTPSPVSLDFGSVSYGTNLRKEPSSNYPLKVWNIGNVDIDVTSLKGYKVNGTTIVDEYIPPEWFAVHSSDACFVGVDLQDGVYVDTGLESIFHSLGSYRELKICLKQILADHAGGSVSQQGYSTSGAGRYPWEIEVSYLLAMIIVRKKKLRKEKPKKKLKSLTQDLAEVFEERLKKKYGYDFEELLDIIEDRRTKWIKIPLDIFKEKVGAAEVLTRYLKDVAGLKFSEIAGLLNRDQRTVSINYNNAVKKGKDIRFGEDSIFISVEIFSDKRLSILESLVSYLRNKGFRNTEIARILDRDERNVATLLSRIRNKFKNNKISVIK